MRQEPESIFEKSFSEFLSKESDNIDHGVSERNLCARLSTILERLAQEYGYIGYKADVEYNKKQDGQIKTIIDDDMNVVQITCDIILHSRGKIITKDNLIAIEMKKNSRPVSEKNKDRVRLRALTKQTYNDTWSNDGKTFPEHVCGYELGYYLELDVEERVFKIELYYRGEIEGNFLTKF